MPAKKRAFISFDYDNDSIVKMYLAGQAKNPDSPFEFKDNSVKAHLAGDWEQKVQRRMDNIDVVIVLCGTKTHTASGVDAELTIAKRLNKHGPMFRSVMQTMFAESMTPLATS